jgi:hypothetical protein
MNYRIHIEPNLRFDAHKKEEVDKKPIDLFYRGRDDQFIGIS